MATLTQKMVKQKRPDLYPGHFCLYCGDVGN